MNNELSNDTCVSAINIDFFRINVNAKSGQIQLFIVAGRGKTSNYGYLLDGTPVIHTPFAFTDEFGVTIQSSSGYVGQGSPKFKNDILNTVSKYLIPELKDLAEVIQAIKNEDEQLIKVRDLKRLENLVQRVAVLDIQRRWEGKISLNKTKNDNCIDK